MGETSIKYEPIHGDQALAIVDAYRERVHDNTFVEALEYEFPYYADELGLQAVNLLHAEDNDTGAYKWRGAIVGAGHLAREGATKFIVPSAGNHARGAVWAARELGMPVTTVVPNTAPEKKRTLIRELWNSHLLNIRTEGETFEDALAWAKADPSGILLHPYGREVIPGQGTVVDDILRLHPSVETIVLPVGGGGLLAGTLRRLGELGRTDILVIGAEAEGSNSLSNSLAAGELTAADAANQRYGGSAVRYVGETALHYAKHATNLALTTVPEGDVNELIDWYESGRKELLREKTPNLEPTSLVAVAALKQFVHTGDTVVVGTGQNEVLHPVRKWVRGRMPI